MDKDRRNALRKVVTDCRRILEEVVGEMLEGRYGITPHKITDAKQMQHLSVDDREYREQLLVYLHHIQASGFSQEDAVVQLIREVAFTHLNRFCAYKMMEVRKIIPESVSRGYESNNVKFYLTEHPEDEQLFNAGQQDVAYRHFLEWLGGTLSEEIGVLFSPHDPANPLLPPQRVLDRVLELINSEDLKDIWAEDETIGWIYQYFTPKELRDQARKESQAPRNSYELAFRNQFYTPSYVVQFLTDNTLGRIWYEMRQGETSLKELCHYLVCRPNEVFLVEGEEPPEEIQADESLSQQDLLQQPVCIPYRKLKDPREIRVLDPACGSGHFLLYCFTLLLAIYEEAWDFCSEILCDLRDSGVSKEAFMQQVPGLILAHNLHGIDIDIRATQIAALALWLRAQRTYQEMGLTKNRPKITKSNIVCAEPMPGETTLLEEFVTELPSEELRRSVREVFDKMQLAGEAGSLLKIEDEIQAFIKTLRKPEQLTVFDVVNALEDYAWEQFENQILDALRNYSEKAAGNHHLQRQLFSNDAVQGFAFIDICLKKFDVVLMNPPFGDASLPSKPYIEDVYGDTRGDVYKAFVECFQDRLVPCGLLGIISSRAGFFLTRSSDWRSRILLRLYRPLFLVDLGVGVLDAMVETAAYVLRSISVEEDQNLTLSILPELETIKLDKDKAFSIPTYQKHRGGLKRHQARQELERLCENRYLNVIESHYIRYFANYEEIKRAKPPVSPCYPLLTCIRLLSDERKEDALNEVLGNTRDNRYFYLSIKTFSQISGSPFAYWMPRKILEQFQNSCKVKDNFTVRSGSVTFNDFRFLRAKWEVPPELQICENAIRWQLISKGGEFSQYYADIHLLIDWKDNGNYVAQCVYEHRPREGYGWGARGRNINFFGKNSVCWSRRSQKGFSSRILPTGCVFSDKSPVIQQEDESKLWYFLGISNSTLFRNLLKIQIAFGSYEVGAIERTPLPLPSESSINFLAKSSFDLKRVIDTASETSNVFMFPALLQVSGSTLFSKFDLWQEQIKNIDLKLVENQSKIDELGFQIYEVSDNEKQFLTVDLTCQATEEIERQEEEGFEDENEDEGFLSQTPVIASLTIDLASYIIGCIFWRWDIRFATGECPKPELPDPFAPLPVYSPGMLTPDSDMTNYAIKLDQDGILVDDPDHPDDIIRRIRNVLEVIWSDNADAIEQEACEILGVKDLRDYFRKPSNGGFWQDHIKRYSKSRRKAPIYWLLQSSKKNYALWLYYHRLDKDILFKAQTQYVEPKLNLENNKLNQLNSQRAGLSGSDLKKLEKTIEKQDSFVSELQDFLDKLKRATNLNLEPDLNDGVVLNIAPLWELVPWGEAKKYWQELTQGKYEWSSISKQLQAKQRG
jgi:hypothetical protein